MIRYPKIRFVDAPEANAVVRFDFNADDPGADAATAVLADDFSLGAPTLRGEPGESGRFYDPRQMSLPVQVHGSKVLALKVQQRLAREVLRPDNWLMVQLNADTEPVWLRTFQSQPNPLNFDLVFVESYNDAREDHWRIPLTLDAEPFAVGSEVTLDLGTVLNNPTLASGGSVIELPEIKGDAPAPLNVLISSASNTMRGLAVASVADGDVIVPWTEPLTFSSAMGSAVADSAFLSGDYHQTTSAVTSSWTAITDPMLITPAARGRYKVLVRVGEDSTSEVASWPARVQVSASSDFDPAATLTSPQTTILRGVFGLRGWRDLGEITLPVGHGDERATLSRSSYMRIQLQRPAGAAGQLRFDGVMLLVPVDVEGADATFLVTSQSASWFDARAYVDSEGRRVSQSAVISGSRRTLLSPTLKGGFPEVHPGRENWLMVLPHVDTISTADLPDDELTVTATYRPQYLNLSGGL